MVDRRSIYSNNDIFDKNGRRRPGIVTGKIKNVNREKSPTQTDKEKRARIVEEIQKRATNGETLDTIVNEIAQRSEVKMQFEYFSKNGITDLAPIFKNWYQSYEKNKDKDNRICIR